MLCTPELCHLGVWDKVKLRGANFSMEDVANSKLSEHDPFTARCAVHCLALLALEQNKLFPRKMLDLNMPQTLYNYYYSGQVDRATGESILLYFAETLHGDKEIQETMVQSLPSIIEFILSFFENNFSKHTGYRCFSALVNLSRNRTFHLLMLHHFQALMPTIHKHLSHPEESQRDDEWSRSALTVTEKSCLSG